MGDEFVIVHGRRRDDTYADELRHRIDSLTGDEDRAGRAMDAVRAVRALIANGGDLDGLYWLLGHAELDHDMTWCGNWHVRGRWW